MGIKMNSLKCLGNYNEIMFFRIPITSLRLGLRARGGTPF